MNRALAFFVALLTASSLRPPCAAAQSSNFLPADSANQQAPAGGSATPSLSVAGQLDDNVLVRENGDPATHDFLTVVSPRGTINYNGRRSQLSASYDGAFLIYRDFNELNSFDQHGVIAARHLLGPHFAVFARNTAAKV